MLHCSLKLSKLYWISTPTIFPLWQMGLIGFAHLATSGWSQIINCKFQLNAGTISQTISNSYAISCVTFCLLQSCFPSQAFGSDEQISTYPRSGKEFIHSDPIVDLHKRSDKDAMLTFMFIDHSNAESKFCPPNDCSSLETIVSEIFKWTLVSFSQDFPKYLSNLQSSVPRILSQYIFLILWMFFSYFEMTLSTHKREVLKRL